MSSGAFWLFGIIHFSFLPEWWIPCTFCSRIQKKQGHYPVEEFTALSMSIHPDQCPFLTVLLWSFSGLLFWSMYACSLTEGIQLRRTRDLLPPQIIIKGTSCCQTLRISHYHGAVLFWCFAQGVSGEVWLCWCVFYRCSNLIIFFCF